MNKQLAKVEENDVINLFRSISFRKSLTQAAVFTKNTGYESGFSVARDFYRGSYHVSGVLEGTTDGFETENRTYAGELADFDFGDQNVYAKQCYRFFSLHFHPDATKCPEPSYSDLRAAQTTLEDWEVYIQADVRPIITVAHILEDDEIAALLYQRKIHCDIEQTTAFEELKSGLLETDFFKPADMVDFLESSGLFYADFLTLKKMNHYRPNKGDYPKLKRFVHTPQRYTHH